MKDVSMVMTTCSLLFLEGTNLITGESFETWIPKRTFLKVKSIDHDSKIVKVFIAGGVAEIHFDDLDPA